MREFAKHGFAGARVERIVSRADVSPRSLYYHFGSKRGLYDAVRERLRAQHFDDFVRGVTDEPLVDRLLSNIDVAMTPRWQQWARMLMWEALDGGADNSPYPKDTVPGDLLAIRAAQERGEIDPAFDPHVLTLAFIAITFWPTMFPQSTKRLTRGMPKDELLQARKELIRTLVQRLGDHTASIAAQELPAAAALGGEQPGQGQRAEREHQVAHARHPEAGDIPVGASPAGAGEEAEAHEGQADRP
jgi:TetR/AcrR family transcriptional regulator